MAFSKRTSSKSKPESPEILFRDHVRAKKVPGLLSHQADILRKYMEHGLDTSDVALQLPTGSGKTLVGLLIAEWRRISKGMRVLYLCPTRQLAHQVHRLATDQYGLQPVLLVGQIKDYDRESCHQYENLEACAISTYSSLFNTNPYFKEPQTLIFDDAHSAENYVAKYWSCQIHRDADADLYETLIAKFKTVFPEIDYTRFENSEFEESTEPWVEKLPNPLWFSIGADVRAIVDVAAKDSDSDFPYPWSVIRDHLQGCQVFFSAQTILIRPMLPPTKTHHPFAHASHRVYMSATLGSGGDLERLFGIPRISRIPAPEGWQKQVIGRRFFLFPERSLKDDEIEQFVGKTMKIFPRALILTASLKAQSRFVTLFGQQFGCSVFTQNDIESSKTIFTSTKNAVAILANRFDGIDFPEEECRLLILTGHPRSVNLQELFVIRRLGAYTLFQDRIITRLLQSFGRCTRATTDRSAVIVLGDTLTTYLMRAENRNLLHPEIQSELQFGIDESKEKSLKEFVENLQSFDKQDKDWMAADSSIADAVSDFNQNQLPGAASLMEAVAHEVEYIYAIWSQNFPLAMREAAEVIGKVCGFLCLTSSRCGNLREKHKHIVSAAADLIACSLRPIMDLL